MTRPDVAVHIGRLIVRLDELPRATPSAPQMADAIRSAMQAALAGHDHPRGSLAQVVADGVVNHPAVAGQLSRANGRPRP